MVEAGRHGSVITRNRQVEVANKDNYLPKQVVEAVRARLPFEFNIHDHTELWKQLAVRPPPGAADPCETDARYCVYNATFKSYAYTRAWIDRIVREPRRRTVAMLVRPGDPAHAGPGGDGRPVDVAA